jgi:membrane protease YdiL (CAAX protease family)
MLAAALGLMAGLVTLSLSWSHLRADPLLVEHGQPSLLVIIAIVLVVALVNSGAEELLWRMALWRMPMSGAGITLCLLAQALSFGVAHASGLPGGAEGMAAAALYSGALAAMRWRWGFGAACVSHLVADMVIFGSVAAHAIFLPT